MAALISEWWNDSYLYRQKVTILNNDSLNVLDTSYTAQLSIDTFTLIDSAALLTNQKDFRVAYWNGSTWTELDRLVEDFNSVATKVWFQIQVDIGAWASDDNYYIYYGQALETTSPPTSVTKNDFSPAPTLTLSLEESHTPAGDVTDPTITTGPTAFSITPTSAIISWDTDEDSNSVVEYGLTVGYGSTETSSTLTDDHDVTITNLVPDTLYNFRVSSTDANSNTVTSANVTFTTETPVAVPTTITPAALIPAAAAISTFQQDLILRRLTKVQSEGLVFPSASSFGFKGVVVSRSSENVGIFTGGGYDVPGDAILVAKSDVPVDIGDIIVTHAGEMTVTRIADYSNLSDVKKYILMKPETK